MLRKRWRSGACFAWARGFRHCCVTVPKSRGWGADFPWLVHVLWARQGMGGGACTPVLGASILVCVWARGAPPPAVRGSPFARGVRGQALSPLRLPSSWKLSGPAAHVLWARVCGYGVQRCPRGPYSLCSSGAGSRDFAARMSILRGVCGQALPLPRLSALWAGCQGPSSTLAAGAGVRVWGQREKECYAIVAALLKLHGWVGNKRVEVRTDHRSLENWAMEDLKIVRGPSPRQPPWHELFSKFDLHVVCTPGPVNPVGDFLSRWAYPANPAFGDVSIHGRARATGMCGT